MDTSDIINITNDSDNEYDMDDKALMKDLIHQLFWQTFGLTTEVVTLTLDAIKKMEDEDKALFSNLVEWAIAMHGMYESAFCFDMFILQVILNMQKLIFEHVIQIQH